MIGTNVNRLAKRLFCSNVKEYQGTPEKNLFVTFSILNDSTDNEAAWYHPAKHFWYESILITANGMRNPKKVAIRFLLSGK